MMAPSPEDAESLLRRIAELEGRLEEAEATLHALGSGQVDAVVVSGPESDQVYTLKGADAPYRVMVQSMSEGALTLMPDGLILFSNEQFASLVGRPLGRVMGARIQELIAPEDAGVIADLLSGGHAAKAEMCLLGESGHVPVYFSLGTLVLDGKQYMCATATDLTQQKSHERVLAAERFARAIVDQSTGVILVADPGGRIIRASRGAEQLAGGEVALRPFDNVFPIGFEEIFARVRETGHVAGVETTAQMPDGRTLQLTLDATLLFGPDDRQIRGCIVVLNDVTRLKRAEQALRDSEEQFRTVADSIAQLAWMADDQGASLWYNRRWYEYTGTTLDEVRDWGWQKLHHPDHVRSVTAHFRHCVETGEPWEDTFPLRGRDGNYRWFLSRAMPIRGADGRILRWFGTNTDITERLESEQRLRQSEARFRRLYDADVVGILSADVHTVYDANDVFLNLIGYSREELQTGRIRWRDLTPPEYLELDEQGIEELLRTGSCKPFEKEYIRKDGARVPVLIGAILLERDPLRWLCVVLDLTERKQLEKHVLEAQKLESVGLLAGGIAHDFNNLLVGMMGNASLAVDLLPEGHPVTSLLERVLQASEHAAHLTRQMLAYSGQGRFLIEPVDLSSVVEDAMQLVRPSVHARIDVRLDLARGLPALEADRSQMQQIFTNLMLNAAEAIGDGPGTITVSTGAREVAGGGDLAPGWYVYVSVRDSGCGMDEAIKSKIFDPFFSTKFTGRGLGLAAVAGIVRSHKGAVEVASAPGGGSTFTVLLPAAERPAALPAPGEAQQDLRGSGTVLVVDDQEIVRTLAKRSLERYGYEVLTAVSGAEAIDLFRREGQRVSLVLLDLSMPGMMGQQILPALREMKRDISVLISSGYSESETMKLFAGLDVAGFIQKPYTARVLAAKVKEVL